MASFEDEALQLLNAGWRQGSTFIPNGHFGGDLGFPGDAVLMVLTQSCSLVSAPLERDPVVEVIVAKRVPKFLPKSVEAKGENARKLMVEMTTPDGPAPFLLEIYSRRTFPREVLLSFPPDGPACSADDCLRVANWVARFYNRSALPNELVKRLKNSGFHSGFAEVLKSEYEAGQFHEEVRAIYGSWGPDDEEGPYDMSLSVLTRSVDANEFALDAFAKMFGTEPEDILVKIDGAAVQIEAMPIDQISVASIENRVRITDWDLLSGLLEEV